MGKLTPDIKPLKVQIFDWVIAALKTVPPILRYFRDSDNIVVFLPRHIRVYLANYLADISSLPMVSEKHDFNLVFEGWKIVDGYENALVVCAVEMAGLYEECVYRVPMTEKETETVLAPIVSFHSVGSAVFKKPDNGIVAFYQPSEPGSSVWKKYTLNEEGKSEFEKNVEVDQDLLLKGCWVERDTK